MGRLAILAAIAAIFLALVGGPAAASPSGTYRYTVSHTSYGNIGTYTNTVSRQGDRTVVDTKIRVEVKALFVILYRFAADRTQVWRNGRMIYYRSESDDDGKRSTVEGRAEGDYFVVTSANGVVVAPGDVFPSNAWSMEITKARHMMASLTGKVSEGYMAEDRPDTLVIDGKPLRTRYFKVSLGYELWYDGRGIPVKFRYPMNGDTYDFTLQRQEPPVSARAAP